MKVRTRMITHFVLALLTGAVVVVLILATAFGLYYDGARRPPWLGNHPENLARVRGLDPNRFRFVVLGDTRTNLRTHDRLLDLTVQAGADFVVNLGDFVRSPEFGYHRFFLRDMAAKRLTMPMLLVLGNHDVLPDREFRVPDFRRWYGPEQLHFYIGDHLFVFLNSSPPYDEGAPEAEAEYREPKRYIAYLREVLEGRRAETDRIFLFMHAYPTKMHPQAQRTMVGTEELKALCREHDVDYVICSHHHGYHRWEADGTVYLVSGGGGAPLYGQIGRFHHMVLLEVDGEEVREYIYPAKPLGAGLGHARRLLVHKVWNGIRASRPMMILAIVGGLAAATACVLFSIRWIRLFRRRRRRAGW